MKEAALQRIEYVPEQLYYAARDGMAISLCSLLEGMSQEQLKDLLKRVSFEIRVLSSIQNQYQVLEFRYRHAASPSHIYSLRDIDAKTNCSASKFDIIIEILYFCTGSAR